jgi:membrane fusion protein (multidrug efflux system)
MKDTNIKSGKLVVLVFLFLVLSLVIIIGVKFLQFRTLGNMVNAQPALTVSTYTVEQTQWEQTLSSIASLEAAKGLVITADLSGRVSKINFDAGSDVEAGDLLIEQDISTEKTQLRSAQSAAILAKSNLDRISELYQKKVVSKSQFDSAKNDYQTAIANVDNIRTTIEKKSIRAPFDGKLGIRLVDLGQNIQAGNPVVSLQATNQMFANFFLPQQYLSKIQEGLSVRLKTDALPGKTFTGKVNAIDPEIDASTRNIKLQAILSNSDNQLLPGMFATLEVVLPKKEPVLMVPLTSIRYAAYGDSVFVVEQAKDEGDASLSTNRLDDNQQESDESREAENLVTRQQFVKLGESRGDFVAVIKGLNAGEKVASVGVFKMKNKIPVVIDNSNTPDFQIKPVVTNK